MIIRARSMKNSLPKTYKAAQTPAFPGMRPREIKILKIASDFGTTAQQTRLKAGISIGEGKICNNVKIMELDQKSSSKHQGRTQNGGHGDNIEVRGFRDTGACTFQELLYIYLNLLASSSPSTESDLCCGEKKKKTELELVLTSKPECFPESTQVFGL